VGQKEPGWKRGTPVLPFPQKESNQLLKKIFGWANLVLIDGMGG